MAEPQQAGKSPAVPDNGIVWCAWHESYSNTARLVRDTGGAKLFACFSCRDAYDLAPVADQP
ncbi:hypothetical protein JCM4814A_00700 [Streptomyces phaeofaciens JCM 4814]|uniref:Uncharacterized protein n=1 Tax=Streptomyces phaeofaciens TaxID=68254 RepID=A0A918HTM2_9ACTN|nr:hypothetical protein [Streptomyces phaeofaciens]GGU00787.1 hypothetical protein GCM10010226_91940 [Streptomyces phaeofaciens]